MEEDVEVGHRVRVLFQAGATPGSKKFDPHSTPVDYEAKVCTTVRL
jgi:hypothetical protein